MNGKNVISILPSVLSVYTRENQDGYSVIAGVKVGF